MTLSGRFRGVGAAGGERHADSRLGEIYHGQADEERGRGDDLEIDESFRAHASYFFQRAAAGNPDDDGGEDERRDDRFDEVKEDVAQEVNGVPPVGPEIADDAADNEANEDLGGERRAIPGAAR